MFKKTLLAMTIATVATATNAASLNSGVTFDDVSGVTAASINGTSGDCQDVANDLGVTLNTGTGAGSPFATATGSDNASVTAGTINVVTTSSVTMTAANVCSIVAADKASTTATASSIEYANKTGNNVSLTPSLVAGAGGYAVNDIITFNVTGGTFDLTNSSPTVTTSGSGVATLFDITANQVRFQVGTAITGKEVVTLANTVLSATGLTTSTEVKFTSHGTRSGVDFDTAAEFKAATLAPQYTASVFQKLNGVIDVASARQAILKNTAQENADNKDQLTVKVKLEVSGNALTPKETNYVISGDFAWLSDAAQVTVDTVAVTSAELNTYLTGFYTGTGDDTLKSISLNATMDKLTVITNAISSNIDTVSNFLFTVPGKTAAGATKTNPTLNAGSFDVTATVTDTTATAITLNASSTLAAGSWTLNGSTIEIPYMPFGDNTQVILRQTVTGTQSGDLSVRYMLEGVNTTWKSVGIVGTSAPGVQNISALVMDAIKTDAGVTKGKVAIELTSNTPSANTKTYAAYKVISETDRGFIGQF